MVLMMIQPYNKAVREYHIAQAIHIPKEGKPKASQMPKEGKPKRKNIILKKIFKPFSKKLHKKNFPNKLILIRGASSQENR
jgi:hypothetical protein